jgi:tetrahydromethanopterin S-methyltransferase subunit A
MSLKEILKINKFKLDEELVLIAGYLQEYSDLHVDAIKRKDKQKIKVEVLEADLIEDIRKNWKEYGYDKSPTAPQMDAFVKLNQKYQTEQEKLIDIQSEVGYYAAAVNSLQAKRSALGNLVELFKTNYWTNSGMFDSGATDVLEETMKKRRSNPNNFNK